MSLIKISLRLRPHIYEPPDGQYGTKIENQTTFTGCVGEVQAKRATIAVGPFTYNDERQEIIDFTFPIMPDPSVVIFQIPKAKPRLWNLFLSCQISVWALTIGFVIIVPVLTTLLSKFSPFSAWNLGLKFAVRDEISFTDHCWLSFGSFFLQGQDFYPYSIASRFLVAFWWIFSAIFFAVYSADLTSVLTLNSGQVIPDTLEEIAESNEIVLYLTWGFIINSILKNSKNAVFQKLYTNSKFVDDCLGMLIDPYTTNVACVTDYTEAIYKKLVNCSRYSIVSEVFETAYTGFLIPKYSDFKEAIDKEIQALNDRGLISKWFQEDLKTENDTCLYDSFIPQPVSFENTAGLFSIALFMNVIGCAIVAIENIMKRFSDPNAKIVE